MDNSHILQQAVTAIKAGDKATGQKLLVSLVQADPRNEYAWLWLSVTMDDPAKRRQCLERVLAINPNNGQAKQGLAKFQTQSPQPLEKLKVEPLLKPIEPPPEPVSLPQSLPATNMQWVDREQLKARLEEASSSPAPAPPKPVKPLRQIKPVKSPSTVERKSSQPKPVSDRKLIEQYIAQKTRQGWQVISQTDSSVQLRKPKKWSSGLLILGALLLIFFGIGLIFLLLALVDYALKKEQIIYVTADELREGTELSPRARLYAMPWGYEFMQDYRATTDYTSLYHPV